jgi:hypothetical protein
LATEGSYKILWDNGTPENKTVFNLSVMTQKSKSIMIEVTEDSIKRSLLRIIKSEHAPIIVDTVIKHLVTTEIGMEDLYYSLQGEERVFSYNIMTEVWVPFDRLPSWRIDKAKTTAKGLVYRDLYLKCKIAEINPLTRSCYRLMFNCVPTGNEEVSVQEYWVDANAIHSAHMEEDDLLPF